MGEKGVVVGINGGDDAMGEGMQCSEHPYRSNPAGGICAFCLQEKLGKLVSSSKSTPGFFPPPPTSSSHDSPSDAVVAARPSDISVRARTNKIPFLSATPTHQKKKKTPSSSSSATTNGSGNQNINLALKRSKSVAPRPLGGLTESGSITDDSPRKKSFWSFLYHSTATNKRRSGGGKRDSKQRQAAESQIGADIDHAAAAAVEDEVAAESPLGSQASSSFGRKVARSRSVGCGSRSFSVSGEFLERISTGFGDCSTLRRVESQREAKPSKLVLHHHDVDGEQRIIKERVKCGGLFGIISSSSSSSSTYWLSAADDFIDNAGRISTSATARGGGGGRSRSWAWASFASPMRAFRPHHTPSSSSSSSRPYAITGSNGSSNFLVSSSRSDMMMINGSSSKLCFNPPSSSSSLPVGS